MPEEEQTLPELPNAPDAELGVLAASLGSPYACTQVVGFLEPADFYVRAHRTIFEAIVEVHESDRPVDLITVSETLRANDQLSQVGGPTAIAALQAQAHPSHARAYASIVKDRAVGRRLIAFGERATQAATTPGDINAAVNALQADLVELAAWREDTAAVAHIGELVDPTLEEVQRIEDAGGGLLGVPSGLSDLDRLLRGFQKQKLYLIAARPAVGKSTVAQTLLRNASKEGNRALFFSMEMDRHELMVRLLASSARIDKNRMDDGTLDKYDHQKLAAARTEVADMRMFLDDRPNQTMASIRATAERTAMTNGGLDLIVIDYVGLIDGASSRFENRQTEMAKISRDLKVLSKELEVPVIALSQLSRAVEQRPEKRPMLADLRDTGALEQDADAVIALYRDDMYDPDSMDAGLMELIILKHRGGKTGTVKVAWMPHMFRVADLGHPAQPQNRTAV